MAFIRDGKLIRRCKECGITSDMIKFNVEWCKKNKKWYTHNICVPCQKEKDRIDKLNWYKKNRRYSIDSSKRWNVDNRERYNKRRRKNNKFFSRVRVDDYVCSLT